MFTGLTQRGTGLQSWPLATHHTMSLANIGARSRHEALRGDHLPFDL